MSAKPDTPYVRIVEQPARSAVRFRYECEGRSAGPIPGVSSTPSCATYPTIQIVNYRGSRAMVVVSCVTVSPPYRQHPHHLVGRVGCHQGVCTLIVDNTDHLCSFTHLGIQCAKRNEISSRLKLRKQLQVDPTRGGFDHIVKSSRGVDLGCVRLCFQVYLEGPESGQFGLPLAPVVSDPVYDKKLLSKLAVNDISTTSSLVTGGKVMLFCNYIDEDDIEVLFFELDVRTGSPVWQSVANLSPPHGEIHKRVGMSFMAPAYRDPTVTGVVKCYMQLRRISDHEASDPIVFYYLPVQPAHNCPFVVHMNSLEGTGASSCGKKSNTNRYNAINDRINSDFISNTNHSIDTNDTTGDVMTANSLVPKLEYVSTGSSDSIDLDINVVPDMGNNRRDIVDQFCETRVKTECMDSMAPDIGVSLMDWNTGANGHHTTNPYDQFANIEPAIHTSHTLSNGGVRDSKPYLLDSYVGQ